MRLNSDPYAWPFDGEFETDNTALLMLGWQQAAVEDFAPFASQALVKAIAILEIWRARGGRSLFGRRGVEYVEDLSAAVRSRNEGRTIDRILAWGEPGWELVIEPRAHEAVIDHPGDSAFFATDLDHLLRCSGAVNLIIAGLPTDGIVHATMRDANDRGYECLLVTDASACHDTALHDGIVSLTAFGNGLFGTTASTQKVVEALS